MKKIFSAILMLSTIPAFATGVPSTETTADCDKPTLNTYTGTSNLQADWRANTIALHWYSDGEELNNIPTASQSCVYDSTLTPPPAPTKTGYTFKGWRVKQIPACSFTLNEVLGMRFERDDYGSKNDTYEYNTDKYGLTTNNSWAREFNTGIIKGIAKCSAKRGEGDIDEPDWITLATETELTAASGEAKHCWCKATNYTPNGGNRCNFTSPSWFWVSDDSSASGCALSCAGNCGFLVGDFYSFREVAFGVWQ